MEEVVLHLHVVSVGEQVEKLLRVHQHREEVPAHSLHLSLVGNVPWTYAVEPPLHSIQSKSPVEEDKGHGVHLHLELFQCSPRPMRPQVCQHHHPAAILGIHSSISLMFKGQ